MKRLLIVLVALLTIAPGCRKKTTKKPAATESIVVKDTPTPKTRKEGIFLDEAVDKFSLQEEEKAQTKTTKKDAGNSFAPANIKNKREAISLFEDEEAADKALESKRSAEQRKYGLKTIYFDFDKFVIRKDQTDALSRNLDILKKLTGEGKTIVVEGHACCSAGSDAYNMILSEKRARAIANWLVKNGLKRKQLKTVGRGYELCIVTGGTREEQAPNRRVEFYVLK